MLGSIIGDVVGSTREHDPIKTIDFDLLPPGSRPTDDSVLTVATADAILRGIPYADAYREWALRYPRAGYGGFFKRWMHEPTAGPYNSFGNGSAMRVSPVAWAFHTEADVLREAERSARATHDHPEGIKGAGSVALALFRARTGVAKADVRREVAERFGYDLARTVEEIRPAYRFDVTCQGSVPEAIIAWLDAGDFEGAVRLAVSLGGDADTQAAIAGGLAEATEGGVPPELAQRVLELLPEPMLEVVDAFTAAHGP